MTAKSANDLVSNPQKPTDYWKNRSTSWTKIESSAKTSEDTFNLRLIEEVGVTPAMRVLDPASGTGDPAITIAGKLTSGNITAYDMTTEMLSVAADTCHQTYYN